MSRIIDYQCSGCNCHHMKSPGCPLTTLQGDRDSNYHAMPQTVTESGCDINTFLHSSKLDGRWHHNMTPRHPGLCCPFSYLATAAQAEGSAAGDTALHSPDPSLRPVDGWKKVKIRCSSGSRCLLLCALVFLGGHDLMTQVRDACTGPARGTLLLEIGRESASNA